MLFFLTGEIQTGKTRWLQGVIRRLEDAGAVPCGVIAPGTWIEHRDGDGVTYEKTGIDNELLPSHEIVPFARRADLVSADEAQAACSQAQRAQLAWAIQDDAINRVNAHLDAIAARTAVAGEAYLPDITAEGSADLPKRTSGDYSFQLGHVASADASLPGSAASGKAGQPWPEGTSRLLIIDELGRLELLRGEGLTSAMRLLDRGAVSALPHALVIVRSLLLEKAFERFKDAPWNGMKAIEPNPDAEREIREALLGAESC